jgi:enamine deaminase RidA (YjgF/YER057c/UK114 family)
MSVTRDARPWVVDVPGLSKASGAWSQATAWRELVAVSGQVAQNESGDLVGGGSARVQADEVFRNLGKALRAAGSDPARLLKLTIYIVSGDDLDDVRAARDEWLGDARPASTLVRVAGLADERMLVEVDAMAVRSDEQR